MFETGQEVRTPEGKIGRIARSQSSGSGSHEFFMFGRDEMNLTVYTVVLEGGKVEQWTEDALIAANPGESEIRRSGSLT